MVRTSIQLVIAIALFGLTACTGTWLKDSWLDSSVTPDQHFKKIAVAALSKDQSVRRMAEDTLVARITRSQAVPSYQLVPESEGGDADKVKLRLLAAGVDGVVVMRLIGVDRQTNWVPGTQSQSFGGYWGGSYGTAHTAGYLQTDTIVQVETNVYSLANDKLLYAARSETFNPADAATVVREIAEAVADDLKKRGVLPK